MSTILTSMTIHHFRNVAPETLIRFRDTFNVFLGKNATGKTTLLDLVAASLSLHFGAYAREAFSISFQLKLDDLRLDATVANLRSEVPSGVAASEGLVQHLAHSLLSPRISMVFTKGNDVVMRTEVADGKIVQEVGGRKEPEQAVDVPAIETPLLMLATFSPAKRDEALREQALEIVMPLWRSMPIVRFDESLRYFTEVVTGEAGAVFVHRSGKGRLFAFPRGAPPEVANAALRAVEKDSDVATLALRDLPLLGTLAQQLGFRTAVLYAQRGEKSAQPDEAWHVSFSGFRFEFVRHDGSTIDHKQLSYGQKRLVAFYYWMATYADVVVADELVNGLHHAWIDGCVSSLQGRQAFLTTQNPLLLDYLPFESEGEVAESFVLCKSTQESGSDRLHWQNIGERDSHGFYQAYKTGIQHVSEILATRGLW